MPASKRRPRVMNPIIIHHDQQQKFYFLLILSPAYWLVPLLHSASQSMDVLGLVLKEFASRDRGRAAINQLEVYLNSIGKNFTLFIRSFASGLTKLGTVISPRAILLWVITGVSSNGASPTKNSYVNTPKLHRSTFSL